MSYHQGSKIGLFDLPQDTLAIVRSHLTPTAAATLSDTSKRGRDFVLSLWTDWGLDSEEWGPYSVLFKVLTLYPDDDPDFWPLEAWAKYHRRFREFGYRIRNRGVLPSARRLTVVILRGLAVADGVNWPYNPTLLDDVLLGKVKFERRRLTLEQLTNKDSPYYEQWWRGRVMCNPLVFPGYYYPSEDRRPDEFVGTNIHAFLKGCPTRKMTYRQTSNRRDRWELLFWTYETVSV